MVYGVIMNFVQSAKYRGGWRGLLEHMYTVRASRVDEPFGSLLFALHPQSSC